MLTKPAAGWYNYNNLIVCNNVLCIESAAYGRSQRTSAVPQGPCAQAIAGELKNSTAIDEHLTHNGRVHVTVSI